MLPILATLLAASEGTASATRPLAGAGPDLGWMATVVAIVLVCIVGAAFGVRKVVGGAWRVRAARRALRVVDVLPLGGRRQVVVVRCYDRTFALGLGEKEVSLVAELDTEFVAAESRAAVEAPVAASAKVAAPAARIDFRGLLQRAASGMAQSSLGVATRELAARARAKRVPQPAADARAGRAHAPAPSIPSAAARSARRTSTLDVQSAEPLTVPAPKPRSVPLTVAEALARTSEVAR